MDQREVHDRIREWSKIMPEAGFLQYLNIYSDEGIKVHILEEPYRLKKYNGRSSHPLENTYTFKDAEPSYIRSDHPNTFKKAKDGTMYVDTGTEKATLDPLEVSRFIERRMQDGAGEADISLLQSFDGPGFYYRNSLAQLLEAFKEYKEYSLSNPMEPVIDSKEINDLYDCLIEDGAISKDEPFDNFKRIFSGERFKSRIVWRLKRGKGYNMSRLRGILEYAHGDERKRTYNSYAKACFSLPDGSDVKLPNRTNQHLHSDHT